MKKRTFTLTALGLASALTITAGISGLNTVFGTSNLAQASEQASDSDSSESTADTSDYFSSRDLEIGYDEETAAAITLNGDSAECDSDAVSISGSTITITDEGTYILTGTLEDGMILIDAEDTDKIQLVLNGVTISNSTSAAIYVRQADKVFITTASGSTNTLSNTGSYEAIDDNNIDAVIFSKDDLTLNGAGTLVINAQAGHGVVSKDDLVITSGTYDITAADHGLSGKDSISIANGTFTITSAEDAIHSENNDDSTLGSVYIAGGTFEINAGDDGIHAGNSVTIEDGTITILQSNEGIEGLSIDINGGDISVTSSDDGLNAAAGSSNSSDTSATAMGPGGGNDIFAVTEGAYIRITGGTLEVHANGDGIDSNGDLYVSGGETYVSGPENGANGSIDYNGTAEITGGIFAAAGASGMQQNFGTDSTQGSILATVSDASAGTSITLTDESGNELFSWTPDVSYSSVLISIPELAEGSTYTLTTGETTTEIAMDSLIYGSEGGMFGMGGGDRGNGGFGRDDSDGGRGGFGGGPNGSAQQGDMTPPQDGTMPQDGAQLPQNGEQPEQSDSQSSDSDSDQDTSGEDQTQTPKTSGSSSSAI